MTYAFSHITHRLAHITPMAIAFLAMVTVIILGLPSNAYAGGPAVDINNCAGPGFQPWHVTSKVVSCIENAVMNAVFAMLGAVQGFMTPIANAYILVAIVLAGIRVVSGEQTGRTIFYAIRLAIVATFFNNLGWFAGNIFAIEGQLINIAAGGFSPWAQIDNFLGNLIGFGPAIVLFQGILGLVAAFATSSSIGVMVFMAGFSAITTLLMFIFNVVYTYLASVIMLGFLIILSPIFVPFAMIFYTERYVKKLLDMILSVMLMPVLLLAFIQLFLGIFDTLILDIFNLLPGGKDFRALWNINNPVMSWVMPSDTSLMERLQGIANTDADLINDINPPVQTNVNPFMRHAFNAGSFGFPGINLGPKEPIWIQELVYKLVALWIFASVMKTMVGRIPEISSAIAGSVISIPLSATSPQQVVENVAGQTKLGFGLGVGGAIGGELGNAAAKASGGNERDQMLARQGGGILGAVGGMMVTKR